VNSGGKGLLSWQTTVVVLALIAAVTALTLHGDVGGEAAIGFLTGALGLVGGAAANATGVRQGSKAVAAPPAD
jgi:hypothetical protein